MPSSKSGDKREEAREACTEDRVFNFNTFWPLFLCHSIIHTSVPNFQSQSEAIAITYLEDPMPKAKGSR